LTYTTDVFIQMNCCGVVLVGDVLRRCQYQGIAMGSAQGE
jgi:hypothetical protein